MSQDDGYFPRRRSILRRVHEERLVGLHYGQRALCIGALAPLNYVGTSEHSSAQLTPFRRLAHTPYPPAQQAAFRATVAAIRAARRLAPQALACGPNTRSFERVARTERWRIERGKPTPQILA